MNNITSLVQQSLLFYVTTANLPFIPAGQVYPGLNTLSAVVPAVVCKCQDAVCTNDEEGTWKAHARIEYRENHDDSGEELHHERAGAVFALFSTATLAEDLSNARNGFTCHYKKRTKQGWYVDGRLWVSYLELDLDCCSSDIP